MSQKRAEIYYCHKCNYKCSKKSNYDRHIMTAKHQMEINGNKWKSKNEQTHICSICNKQYATISGLWKHQKKSNCSIQTDNDETLTNNSIDTNSIIDILKQNKELIIHNSEFKNLIMEQSKQLFEFQQENQKLQKRLIDAVKDSGNVYNNTTTNNNQKFNLNFFLNNTCKDAMNMSEFIENMEVQFEDIENIGRDGYVTGMTNMIMSRIKNLEVTKRPMHCTDLKRETIYIKDNNVWEKDDDNKKLHNMIQCIAHKNYAILPAWRDKNPDCLDSDTPKFDFCIKMMTNVLGDTGEGQIKLDNKVIRNIAKHINVDKSTNAIKNN
jgi:hypothetical protein